MHWLWWTDGGLAARVGVGAMILAVLAWVDVRRNGAAARRWREYMVLLACAAAAMGYGLANDQVTATISWEYFYYGKQLDRVLGPAMPPANWALRLEAAKLGVKAAWGPGLLIGVAMLLANNPRQGRPQLPCSKLVGLLPMVLLATVLGSAALGVLGYAGLPRWVNSTFGEMLQCDIWRPRRFLCVWGTHLGAYAGGIVGTALAVRCILRQRRSA